jgi:hypothetical protein
VGPEFATIGIVAGALAFAATVAWLYRATAKASA